MKVKEGDRVIVNDTYFDVVREGTVDWVGATQFVYIEDYSDRRRFCLFSADWKFNGPA